MEKDYKKRGYLLEDFRLFHLRDSQGAGTDYHYHEFCKLLLMISGSGAYAVEGRRYALKPGDLVLLGSHCVHKPEFEEGRIYERIILYIRPSFLQRESTGDCSLEACFSEGPVLRLPERRWKKLLTLAESLEQELSGERYGRSVLCNSLLLQLLVEVGRCSRKSDVQWMEPMAPRSGPMEDLIRYLDQNLTQELSVDQLAEQFYLSKYHLMRRFRQETGTTIHAYITEHRLFFARDLITQGVSSTEACYRAGFGSYSAFTRAYGKLFGTTPTGRRGLAAERDETYE